MYSPCSGAGQLMIYSIFSVRSSATRNILLRPYKYLIISRLTCEGQVLKIWTLCAFATAFYCRSGQRAAIFRRAVSHNRFRLMSSEALAEIRLTWHVKAKAFRQSPRQSSDLILFSSGRSSGSGGRVLVTHMANYRWKRRGWWEPKACSHVAGVQTPCGCIIVGRGREKLINSWAILSSPLFTFIWRTVEKQSLRLGWSVWPLNFLLLLHSQNKGWRGWCSIQFINHAVKNVGGVIVVF